MSKKQMSAASSDGKQSGTITICQERFKRWITREGFDTTSLAKRRG